MPIVHRGIVSLALVIAAFPARAEEPIRIPSLRDSVEVDRVLLEARVLDGEGRPVRGLGVGDFHLRVNGDVLPVLSVDWIEGFGGSNEPGPVDRTRDAATPPGGRYTVLLIQRDLDPSRIVQLMRIKTHALKLIEDMRDHDRLAVLLHENGLHLLADFTGDRDGLRRVVDEAVVQRGVAPPVRAGDGPSLRALVGEDGLRRAVHVETALLRLAEALESLPGTKTVFFFAWGMGVFAGGDVLQRPDQRRAEDRLRAAHATLLTVDLTNADYHSLETPLIEVTRATGGLYVKGHVRPSLALQRLRDAAAGAYLLSFAPPDGDPPLRSIRVTVPGTGYEVLHRASLDD